MNIHDIATIQDIQIIMRYPDCNGQWYCNFEKLEIKDGVCLVGETGRGINPLGALQDYVHRIRGKRAVIDAYRPTRREFDIPNNLEI